MGRAQHTNETGGPQSGCPRKTTGIVAERLSTWPAAARGRRLGWRVCLCKDCGRKFRARQYNQRYCRERGCLDAVHRWQAAKRQQKCRADPAGRQRHAEAERQRRKQKASQAHAAGPSDVSACDADPDARAWSRSARHPEIFCNRPGCYEPLRNSPRAAACYCSDECRAAVNQARDRERKWLQRKRKTGRFKRRLEYQAARDRRRQRHVLPDGPPAGGSSNLDLRRSSAVLDYRSADDRRVGFEDSEGGRGLTAASCGNTPRGCRTRRSSCTSFWRP
jgi:hypothetical protein